PGRSDLRGPDLPRSGHRRRPERRPSRGHRHQPHRPLADRDPRVCERGHRARGVRRPTGVVPHHRPAAPRGRAAGAHPRPPPAVDPPHARPVRLYRPDGAGGHGGGDGVGLHPDGGAEGAAAPVCDPAPRPAQRALADDHGHRITGGLAGGAVVVLWIFAALEWKVVTPYDPFAVGPAHPLAPPSGAHWLGTDDLGRDVLSRVLAGAAPVLTIAPTATLLSLLGGTTIGLVAGFHRGLIDDILMRLVDAVMSLPVIIPATVVLALAGRSTTNVIL